MDLYEEICHGISFLEESGKIQSIHFPSIRYFAYFIAKCVLARKTTNKLSSYDLAFISAALRQVLELCPRGNNKDVIIIILVHDNVYIPC
jgi:hypothetical protein